MAGTIHVIVACDADPDRPDYGGTRFNDSGPLVWNGMTEGVPKLLSVLEGVTDHRSRALPVIWCLRADSQIERCHGKVDWAIRQFADLSKRLEDAGHVIGWHPHHWRWSRTDRCFFQETKDRKWQISNLNLGHSAFKTLPKFSRTGWYAMDDRTLCTLEELGVGMDLSAMPGMEHLGGPDKRGSHFVGQYDWSRCREIPYRPHPQDYQSHQVREKGIVELPCTTVASRAINGVFALRYKMRGGPGGYTGQRVGLNITAHPLLFSAVIRQVLGQAKAGRSTYFASYFHADELLGTGPGIGGTALYKAEHVAMNLNRLLLGASKLGLEVLFENPQTVLERLDRKLGPKSDTDYLIEPIGKDNMNPVIELSGRVFTRAAEIEGFEKTLVWKHTRLSRKGPWIMTAKSPEGLLGQYPSLAVKTWWFDREVLCAHSCDTAVLPEAQGRGVLGDMARAQYDRLRDNGFSFAWAFPNERIFPIRTKSLAWKEVAPFPFLLRPLPGAKADGINTKALLAKGAGLAWGAVKPIDEPASFVGLDAVIRFDKEGDRIWDEAKNRLRIALVRDSQALNRRYADAPDNPYRLFYVTVKEKPAGVAVTRLMEKRGLLTFAICELLLAEADPEITRQALAVLLKTAVESGAQVTGACCLPQHPEYKGYKQAGFLSLPRRLHPEPTYFAAYPLAGSDQSDKLFNAANWYLSWGDQDTL